MRAAIALTLLAWGMIEIGLILRDGVRGRGSTAADKGTRRIYAGAWIVAFVLAYLLESEIGPGSPLRFGRWHAIAGLVIIWIGVGIRFWAVIVLGNSFRTTVEVEPGQAVVERGPYRLIRHPAYTGLTVVSVGVGIALGNWLSLAVFVLLPLAATLRRIRVEEAALASVLGQPYQAYQERTKRLVPGIW
jgi:protein-S-isoprenylcysteine O-methyltransferase Ste14